MKFKFKKYIVLIVIISITILGGVFYSVSMKGREAITVEGIKQLAEDKGYMFYDLNDMAPENMGQLCAIEFDDIANIQFSETISEESAVGIYNVSHLKFQSRKGDGDRESYVKTKHYEKYSLITESSYMLCIRVENTILYSDSPIEYKEQIDQFVKEIDY